MPPPARPAPVELSAHHADVAQLVAHHLAKVRVAGSNPVVRSAAPKGVQWGPGPAAGWPSGLGKGLQSPVRGFDSRSRLAGTMLNGSKQLGRLAQSGSALP